jgi:hypothetical protein
MAMDNSRRSTEHPIDRPPDTDPQQGHEHPEADPRKPQRTAPVDVAPPAESLSGSHQPKTGSIGLVTSGGQGRSRQA